MREIFKVYFQHVTNRMLQRLISMNSRRVESAWVRVYLVLPSEGKSRMPETHFHRARASRPLMEGQTRERHAVNLSESHGKKSRELAGQTQLPFHRRRDLRISPRSVCRAKITTQRERTGNAAKDRERESNVDVTSFAEPTGFTVLGYNELNAIRFRLAVISKLETRRGTEF